MHCAAAMSPPSPPPSPGGSFTPQRQRSGGGIPFHMQNQKPKRSGLAIPARYSKSTPHPNAVRSAEAAAAARYEAEVQADENNPGPAAVAAAKAAATCRRAVNSAFGAAGLPVPPPPPARQASAPPPRPETDLSQESCSSHMGSTDRSAVCGTAKATSAAAASRKATQPPRSKSPQVGSKGPANGSRPSSKKQGQAIAEASGEVSKDDFSSPAKVQTESKRAGRDDTGGGDSTVLLSNRSAVSDANPKQLPANGAAAPTHADLNPASMANSADVKTTESLARVESLASASDHVVLPASSSAPAALPLAESTALAGTAVAVAVPLPGPGPVPLSAPVLAPVPTQVSVAVAPSASSAAPAPAACAPAPAACAPAPAACALAPAACAPAPASETARVPAPVAGSDAAALSTSIGSESYASSLPAPPKFSISTGLSATTSEASSAPAAQLVTPRTAAAAEASIIEAVLTPRQVKVTQSTAGIPSPVLDLQASIEDDPVAESEVGSSRRASEESAINDLSSLTANVASIPTASIEAPDDGRTALSDGTLLPIALQPVVLPAGSSRVVHTKVPMLLLPPPGASLDADGLSGPVAARAAPRLDPSCSAEVTGQSSLNMTTAEPLALAVTGSARQQAPAPASARAPSSGRAALSTARSVMTPTTAEAVAKAVAAAATTSSLGSGRRPPEPVEVQVAISIRRLWDVDFSAQTYRVALTAFTYHESHAQDSITTPRSADKGLKLVNGDKAWQPKRFLPSLSVADAVELKWAPWQFMLSPEAGPHGRRMLLGKRELTATIRNDFDLDNFPFDIQTIELRVGLDADPSVGYMTPMRPPHPTGDPNVVDVAYDDILFHDVDFIDEVPHAQGIRILRTLPPNAGPNRLNGAMAFSQAFVCIPIARVSRYYVSAVGGVFFTLGLCMCSTFAISVYHPTLRLAADLGLLLVTLAFKTYLGQALPRTAHSYTRLDSLSAACWLLLILVSFCHGALFLCQIFYSESIAVAVDSIGFSVWMVGWLLYIMTFAYACLTSAREEERRMHERLAVFSAEHDTEVDVVEGLHAPGTHAVKLEEVDLARRKGTQTPPRKLVAKKSAPKKVPPGVPVAAPAPSSTRPKLSPKPAKTSANIKPKSGPKSMV